MDARFTIHYPSFKIQLSDDNYFGDHWMLLSAFLRRLMSSTLCPQQKNCY